MNLNNRIYLTPKLIIIVLIIAGIGYGVYYLGQQDGLKSGFVTGANQGYQAGIQKVQQDLVTQCQASPQKTLTISCDTPKTEEPNTEVETEE